MPLALITRKDARKQGLKLYFTGRPCKYGHNVPRRTANCACTVCELINSEAFLKRQPDYYREYRLLNQETLREYDKARYRKRKAR